MLRRFDLRSQLSGIFCWEVQYPRPGRLICQSVSWGISIQVLLFSRQYEDRDEGIQHGILCGCNANWQEAVFDVLENQLIKTFHQNRVDWLCECISCFVVQARITCGAFLRVIVCIAKIFAIMEHTRSGLRTIFNNHGILVLRCMCVQVQVCTSVSDCLQAPCLSKHS